MMEVLLIKLALAVVGVLATVISGYVVKLLSTKIGREKLHKIVDELYSKKDLAMEAIRLVEQMYGGKIFGEEKYTKAANWLKGRLNSLGFSFTEDEIKGLIESCLMEIKEAVGNEWGKASKEVEVGKIEINVPDASMHMAKIDPRR
jgi:LL-H family phage holin